MRRRNSSLNRLSPLLVAIAIFVQGCTADNEKTLVYGAARLPDNVEGNSITGDTDDLKKIPITRIVEASLEISRKELWPCLNKNEQRLVDDIKVTAIKGNSAAFLMYSSIYRTNSGLERNIYISDVTWRNFNFVALASRLQEENVGIDTEWIAKYMLFNRATSDFDGWVSPIVASGLGDPEQKRLLQGIDANKQTEIINDILEVTKKRTTFLLAHEYYHHIQPLPQRKPGESLSNYTHRQRLDEQNADMFAMNKLFCRVYIKRNLHEFSGAQGLFIDWILLMQGARHSLTAGSHPLDHVRARNVAHYVIGLVSKLERTPDKQEILDGFNEVITLTNSIDNKGASAYFGELDDAAKQISLESLQIKN